MAIAILGTLMRPPILPEMMKIANVRFTQLCHVVFFPRGSNYIWNADIKYYLTEDGTKINLHTCKQAFRTAT